MINKIFGFIIEFLMLAISILLLIKHGKKANQNFVSRESIKWVIGLIVLVAVRIIWMAIV